MASAFKLPVSVPQDLLLIQDLVGEIPAAHDPPKPIKLEENDDISSSDSEPDSEGEVEAGLDWKDEDMEDVPLAQPVVPSDSSSDSDSDSDSDASEDVQMSSDKKFIDEDLEDEDSGPAATTGTYFQTKNEVPEVEPDIPTVEEVGPDELLEHVGEIMSVVGNTVIIKGLAAGLAGRASERALDSDTLLVFEDRKVLGFVYETFGPTHQPMYQVKFSQKNQLDLEKVQPSRQVFHLPNRSNFVFLSQIKKWKGSDASNVHDEEPADDELEFSDDEEEAAFKSQRKRKRGESRAGSVTSSRYATPTPSQMRDQDLIDDSLLTASAYAERGPYDFDFSSAGPSRPAPIPYDDPYSTEYTSEKPDVRPSSPGASRDSEMVDSRGPHRRSPSVEASGRGGGRGRGRGRGRGGGHDRADTRRDSGGRGRARGRGWVDRGRGGRPNGYDTHINQSNPQSGESHAPPRSMSPTSLAIARATGQLGGPDPGTAPQHAMSNPIGGWQPQQHPQMQPQYNFGIQQQPFVQPHINPRFASQFGMNFGFMQPQFYPPNPQFGMSSNAPQGSQAERNWTDEWTVYGGDTDASAGSQPSSAS